MKYIVIKLLLFIIWLPTLGGFWNYIKEGAETVGNGIKEGAEAVGDGLEEGVNAVSDTFDDVTDLARQLIGIDDAVDSIANAVKDKVVPSIPYIDQIPTVVPSIATKIDQIPYINKIPTVVPSISDKIDNIPYINQIPTVVDEVENIPGIAAVVGGIGRTTDSIKSVTAEIPIIGDTLDNVQGLANQIPGIGGNVGSILGTTGNIERLTNGIPGITTDVHDLLDDTTELLELLKNGLFTVGDVADDIDKFGETLESCFESLLQIIQIDGIFDVIKVPDFSNDIDIDFQDLAFKALATILFQYKGVITFVCDNIISDLVIMVERFVNSYNQRRRLENHNSTDKTTTTVSCKKMNATSGQFCNPYQQTWPRNAEHSGLNDYEIMLGYSVGIIGDKYKDETANPDRMQEWRAAQIVLKMFFDGVFNLCQVKDACSSPDKKIGCQTEVGQPPAQPHMKVYGGKSSSFGGCMAFKLVTSFGMDFVNYAVANAVYHNNRINGVKLNAIFRDRKSIIYNQFGLKNIIETEFDALTEALHRGIIGTLGTIETSTYEEKYTLRKIVEKIDALSAKHDAKAEQGQIIGATANHDEEGLIILKVKPSDLYIFGAIFMGCNVAVMIIAMFVFMKCYNGYQSGPRFTPVPKYDYSTSDVEDAIK